jgi:HEAT repeat protein
VDFVRALALAWKNLAAYPAGHPALAGALDQAQRKLDVLRGAAGDVTFGVGSDGLLYGIEKLATEHAQKFAYVLYTNRVAVLTFGFGVGAEELSRFLQVLGVGARATRASLWDELAQAGVANIHLTPVDYSGVQVTDTLDAPSPDKTTLWDEILRALLAGREISGQTMANVTSGIKSVDDLSAMIARTIDDAKSVDGEFDPNATFGIKLTARVSQSSEAPEAIMRRVAGAVRLYIAGASGTRRQLAVQQIAHLVGTLAEPMRAILLRAALEALTSDDSAGALLRDLAASIQRDYLLEALRQLDASKFAGHAVDLLRSLAPEVKTSRPALEVPAEIDRELIALFGEEDIDRFNPPDHQALLDDVSLRFPHNGTARKSIADLGKRVDSVAEEEVTRQLVDAMFELLWNYGEWRPPEVLLARIESAFHAQISNGRFNDALVVIERMREIAGHGNSRFGDAASESLERLASPSIINDLLGSVAKAPERASDMHKVIQALGLAVSRAVLVALTEEDNRSRRRRLFDFAVSLGPAIVPDAPEFLHDNRWFVVRNMIMLLRAVNDRTLLPELRRCAHNPDLRVRLEAIKTLLAFDTSVPRALLDNAINDPDPKLAETAIALVGSYGIKEAADPLLQMLAKRDVFGTRMSVRVRAIKALGELRQADALARMGHLFKDSFLPWPSVSERRAAYESLSGYPAEARQPFVERGLKSRDPIVRDICRRLAGS